MRCLSSPVGLHPSLEGTEEAAVSSQSRQQERSCICGSLFVWMEEQLGACRPMQRVLHRVRLADLPGVPARAPQQICPEPLLAPSRAWVLLWFTPGSKSKVIALKPTYTLQGAATGQSSTCTHKTAQHSKLAGPYRGKSGRLR